MRYEAGDCANVISIKRAFKRYPKVIFDAGHIFASQSEAIYNPWFFMILGQYSTYSKIDII